MHVLIFFYNLPIGVIKTDKKTRGKKIWLYRDKATGALKGDGTVSYEDPFSAGSAVEWFNQKEWKGALCLNKYSIQVKQCPEAFRSAKDK